MPKRVVLPPSQTRTPNPATSTAEEPERKPRELPPRWDDRLSLRTYDEMLDATEELLDAVRTRNIDADGASKLMKIIQTAAGIKKLATPVPGTNGDGGQGAVPAGPRLLQTPFEVFQGHTPETAPPRVIVQRNGRSDE